MGKIDLNKAIGKIFGESPTNDEMVKDLLLLMKGKFSEKSGRVKWKKESSIDENCMYGNEKSFGESLERWAENMKIITKIKDTLVRQVITISTLREIQVSEDVNLETAVEIAGKEIENVLQERIQSNYWLSWLKPYEDAESETNGMLDKILEIAVEGYMHGYVDGFSDREKFSAKYCFDEPKKYEKPRQCANTDEARLKYQP